jgi:hypothetical protein
MRFSPVRLSASQNIRDFLSNIQSSRTQPMTTRQPQTATENPDAAFQRFLGQPVTLKPKTTYPEREFEKVARLKNVVVGYKTELAMWVAGQGLVRCEEKPILRDMDVVVGTYKKRVRQVSTEFTGRAAASLRTQAARAGLKLRFLPEGYYHGGMNYDPRRLNVHLSRRAGKTGVQFITGFSRN